MLDFDLKLMCCIHLLHELENLFIFFGHELHVFYYFSGGGMSPAPFQKGMVVLFARLISNFFDLVYVG